MTTGALQPEAANPPRPLEIEKGVCHVIFAYDAARAINLDESERRIRETSTRQKLRHKRRAPSYFEYQPAPLRVSLEVPPIAAGRFVTRPSVDLQLFDFGAVAAVYTIEAPRRFTELLDLSEELYDNRLLLEDSRARVSHLLEVLGDAVTHAFLAPVVEDYVVFHLESFTGPFDADRFCAEHRAEIAGILRAERRPLSAQEVEDALSARLSYRSEDVIIVDWNAALLIDPEGDDVREVLQFANVELIEMRYLDQRLDLALDQAYETLSRRPRGLLRMIGHYGADLRGLAELQVDNAILFEGVNNALKLLGDQYLARAYRLVSRRFHLDGWDASILRKLETLESVYQKLSDQAATRRMEILEWMIIILFILSLALELSHFEFS
jgi:hypothetical protein